jgi:hypothetical protein
MGRHSAGGDDEDDLQPPAGAVIVAVESRGRHASPDQAADEELDAPAAQVVLTKPGPPSVVDTAPTAPIAPIAADEADWSTAPIPPVEAPEPATEPEPSPTARDFALFRAHPDVRNRAIAAVLAPFVVYAVVMVVIGRTNVFLIWLWIPVILAGVLMGLILDLGHKRYGAKGSADRP